MAKEVVMPALSPSMTEGTVVKWLKKEGDEVKQGEVIAEVETDKATMDLESFDSGILKKIIYGPGSKVAVNTLIAVLGAKDEVIDPSMFAVKAPAPAAKAEVNKPAPLVAAPAKSALPSTVSSPISRANGRVKASPLAKKIAAEMGLSVSYMTGTGPGGRVVKRDVFASKSGANGSGGWGIYPSGPIAKDERIALSNMRQTIGRRLQESKSQIPHFYLEVEVDVESMLEMRVSLNKSFESLPQPFKLSPNDFVLKAVAEALRKVPTVNSSYEGDTIRQFGNVGLAFAVAIPNGLITPVIQEAQNKNLKQIADEVKALASRAREGKLKPEEYTTGTFTVSNLGMYGVDRFQAIVNPPQAAILAVGAALKKPIVNKHDQVVMGQRMSLTLSCDHRVVDGAVGAEFLAELKRLLETPALLLI
ncbi:MAG: pyruvate dehydrogenase complex dihydrolipoamide acetyltransferase [Verrucomicrobiota bacterium]